MTLRQIISGEFSFTHEDNLYSIVIWERSYGELPFTGVVMYEDRYLYQTEPTLDKIECLEACKKKIQLKGTNPLKSEIIPGCNVVTSSPCGYSGTAPGEDTCRLCGTTFATWN